MMFALGRKRPTGHAVSMLGDVRGLDAHDVSAHFRFHLRPVTMGAPLKIRVRTRGGRRVNRANRAMAATIEAQAAGVDLGGGPDVGGCGRRRPERCTRNADESAQLSS